MVRFTTMDRLIDPSMAYIAFAVETRYRQYESEPHWTACEKKVPGGLITSRSSARVGSLLHNLSSLRLC